MSCEVRNENVDVKREIQQKDMLTESFSPRVLILKDTCRNTEREGEERDLRGFI